MGGYDRIGRRFGSTEERYRALLKSIREGLVEIDIKGRLCRVNQRAVEILGLKTPDDVLGRPFTTILVERSRRMEAGRIRDVLSGRARIPKRIKWVIPRDNGLQAVVEVRPFPLTEKGQLMGLGAVLADVTELSQAEAIRRKSEERIRSLVEHLPILVVAFDEDGRFIFWNKECARVTGYQPEEIVGNPRALELLYPNADYRAEILNERNWRSTLYRDWELDLTAKNGKRRRVAWASIAAHTDFPEWASWNIGVDVTERTRIEHEQRMAQRKYRRLAENAPEMVWRTDEEEAFLYVDESAKRILGISPSEAISKPLSSFLTEESQRSFHGALHAALQSDPPQSKLKTEIQLIHRDGHIVTCEINAALDVDQQGRLVAMNGIARDLTDLIEAKEKREAQEAPIRRAQRMESINRLATGVARKFNNVLTTITCSCEFLLQEMAPEDPRSDYVEEIGEAARQATDLTNQLATLGHRQDLSRKYTDLSQSVLDLEGTLRMLVGDHIDLIIMTSGEPGRIELDSAQIEKVLKNLAANARDAMPEGGELVIDVRNVEIDTAYAASHHEVQEGPYVLLEISDTGVGMEEDAVSHLFEPFFTTKDIAESTGMGLSLVYGIATQVGGHITVFSEPREGTTIHVYFPLFLSTPEPVAVPQPFRSSVMPANGATILLVEDEPIVRKTLAKILERSGYRVLAAADGDEAMEIEKQCKEPILLAICDVVIPGLNGCQVARKISGLRPGLRVLYISGYTGKELSKLGLLEGGFPLLMKPFTPEGLLEKVRETLSR